MNMSRQLNKLDGFGFSKLETKQATKNVAADKLGKKD